jgi:hypothetical protein
MISKTRIALPSSVSALRGRNLSAGEIALGEGFAALISNGQTRSPITHTNWEGTGVEPDVVTNGSDALIVVYKLALKEGLRCIVECVQKCTVIDMPQRVQSSRPSPSPSQNARLQTELIPSVSQVAPSPIWTIHW